MSPYIFISFFVFISFPIDSLSHGGELERQTLLISFDGFRWDYVERIRRLIGEENSNIWRLVRNGAFAVDGVTSSFTTMTFPNHYTLVTGLYQENHGIVSNLIYDPIQNRTFDLKNLDTPGSLYGGEPIWTTLSKQVHSHEMTGGSVGCIMWVACQYSIPKKYFVAYNHSASWESRIDKAIDWLMSESMKLVLVYYHEPDQTGHFNGTESAAMDEKLKELDLMVGFLMKKLDDKGMLDELNLVIVSDHGMTDRKQADTLIPDTLPTNMFNVRSPEPALWLVEPLPGRQKDTVAYFRQFPHLKVYEKENLPEKWHYKNNIHVSPVVIVADPGYTLSEKMAGNHGHDNDNKDMRPTFIARGPAFVANSTVPPLMGTVDVYLLLCTILDLKPAPNNGTASYFDSFVQSTFLGGTKSVFHRVPLVTIIVCISVTLFALLFFVCHRRRVVARRNQLGSMGLSDNNGYMYKPLPLESVGPLLTTTADLDLDDSDEFEEFTKRKP